MNAGKLRRVSSLNINDTRIAGLYDLEHTIGKGHFAVVKLARHVFTGEKVAVKVIDKTRLDPVSTAHMMQEVRCMKLVQHPNIIRLYEIIDTQTKLFLILELGDYDMYDYIMKQDADRSGGFRENDAQQYFNQIIKAIDYCHALHVVHRDLKPENVIFFEKLGMVKLTDFGFSNLFTPGQQLQTSCGSLAYSAPEILLGDAYEAPAVDVWSLGVILYMLVCGRLPFQEANESETLTKILDCKFSVPDYISAPCKHLISRMLIRDPSKRATLSEVIRSPWVVAGERGHAEALPLIIREHLPESAHSTIVEQMVAGGIGTEDDIVSSIESDMYNYLTATYYLLAERVLAAYRQEQASRLLLNSSCVIAENYCAGIEENENNENASTSANQQHTGSNLIGGRSRSNSWRGSTAARRPCTILKEESEEELSSYLRSSSRQSSSSNAAAVFAAKNAARGRRFQPPLLRRNSSPSVSMFGGVCVQSSSGLRASRDRVSPQAIQELLEFSRISGRRAASPDSRISSRSSSPPCSSGRASPAVTAIVSRLKASNLLPSTSGMRKLSSSPHLLGICEESEDGSLDYPNSTAASSSVTHNRSFGGGAGNLGTSASMKRRSSRSASIGFAYARNSQRSSDVGMSFGDVKLAELKGTPVRCTFSTSFEQITLAKPISSTKTASEMLVVAPEREESDDVLGDLSPPKVLSTLLPANLSSGSDSHQHARLKRNISSSSTCSTQSTRSASAVMSAGGFSSSGNGPPNAGSAHPRSHSSSISSTSSSSSQKLDLRNTPTNASVSPSTTTSFNTLRFVASPPQASTDKLPEVFLDRCESTTGSDHVASNLSANCNTVTVSTTFSSVASPPLCASAPGSDRATEPPIARPSHKSTHGNPPVVS